MTEPARTIDPGRVGVVGWRCMICEAFVDIAEPLVFRCPNWSVDEPHHALRIVRHDWPLERAFESDNPFLAYEPYFAWSSCASALGLGLERQRAMVAQADARVARVAGHGFVITPFERSDALSEALGFTADGGTWVKDETGQVAGSHKSRHLFTTMLHLLSVEAAAVAPWGVRRPPLAIASCGNAALAAATLAAAEQWPLQVFVPPWADQAVVERLEALGAGVTSCPRRDGDPPGDPCIARFREAVAQGALPFSVQGPDNAWCVDGGRTIGWEMATLQADHLFVQVGGGALARCAIGGLSQAGVRHLPRIHAVQTEGCAPLARAWQRVIAGPGGADTAAQRWRECMTPWETPPQSAASGILDDETYDGLAVVAGMASSHGAPVIAKEDEVVRAHELARATTGIDVSVTGSAGLAGLLAIRDVVSNHHRVALIFSGSARAAQPSMP